MGKLEERYIKLSKQEISSAIERLNEIGEKYKADKRTLIKTALSVEEILLNYQEYFGEETEIRFKLSKIASKLSVVIELKGTQLNPLVESEDFGDSFILDSLDMGSKYIYKNGINRIGLVVRLNESRKVFVSLFASVAIGVLLGLLGKYLPETAFDVLDAVLTGTADTIFGLMNMVATPVIFFCVIRGIVGNGSAAEFKKNGVKVISRYLIDLIVMLVIAVAIAIPVFNLDVSIGATTANVYDAIIDTFFSIFPNNIVAPFYDSDNVKVVILGLLVGLAMLVLKERSVQTEMLVQELQNIFTLIMEWIAKLIPVLLVAVISTNMWDETIDINLLNPERLIFLYLGIILAALLIYIGQIAISSKKSFKDIARIVIAPGIKGLVSGSSMICFTDMEKVLTEELGVSEEDKDYALPLAMAFFQPVIILFALFVTFFAASTGMEVSPSWVVSLLIICYMVGIAAPPVAGGAVALLMIIFTSLGIPEELISIAAPIFMLLDYPNTGFRVSMIIMEIAKICNLKKK